MSEFIHEGLRLNFELAGEGVPILLVHGYASSLKKNWREPGWFETLGKAGHQVIAFDHRGHGLSDKPHDPALYDTDAMARDAIALLDHLGHARAHFFGYSMGAMVGLRALALAPQRFHSVILAGIGANMTKREQSLVKLAAAMRAADPKTLTDPMQIGFRAFADSQPNDLLALAACAERPRRPAARADYEGKSLPPVLIIAGEADELAQGLDVLAAEIPGAITATVPRRNHMTAVGDKETKRRVLEFLDGL
jgi:pimeloyl-ACP methyl ester carboxylesterase